MRTIDHQVKKKIKNKQTCYDSNVIEKCKFYNIAVPPSLPSHSQNKSMSKTTAKNNSTMSTGQQKDVSRGITLKPDSHRPKKLRYLLY